MIQVILTLLVVFAYFVIVEENIFPMMLRQGDGLQQSIMVHFAFTKLHIWPCPSLTPMFTQDDRLLLAAKGCRIGSATGTAEVCEGGTS